MNEFRQIGQACLALHLRRAARQAARIYDEALRPAGINNGQFSLLAMLAAREDWAMQQLADALGLDQSSLSAAVKPLEREGLLRREIAKGDARVRRLRLTHKGKAVLEGAVPLWRRAQDRCEAVLGAGESARARSLLRQFAELPREGTGGDGKQE